MRGRRSIGQFGEAGLIELITAWLKRQKRCSALLRGIGDDCASVALGSGAVLLTNDAFVENVHFKRSWMPAWKAGWKSLAANVSDIAAAGGAPVAALISLELPGALPVRWVEDFYGGLLACGRRYGVALAGGNVCASSHVAIHISLIGKAPKRMPGRNGARPGDLLVVTGRLGGARAGLLCLRRGLRGLAARAAVERHLMPRPDLRAGQVLARHASAQVDISDGLVNEARLLANASRVQVVLVPGAVPVHTSARALATELGMSPLALALTSGEEYELLATVPRARWRAKGQMLMRLDAGVTVIGEVRRGRGVSVLGGGGSSVSGYDHFR